jgi:hypothetical protein
MSSGLRDRARGRSHQAIRAQKGAQEMKVRLLVLLTTLTPVAAFLGGWKWP